MWSSGTRYREEASAGKERVSGGKCRRVGYWAGLTGRRARWRGQSGDGGKLGGVVLRSSCWVGAPLRGVPVRLAALYSMRFGRALGRSPRPSTVEAVLRPEG